MLLLCASDSVEQLSLVVCAELDFVKLLCPLLDSAVQFVSGLSLVQQLVLHLEGVYQVAYLFLTDEILPVFATKGLQLRW